MKIAVISPLTGAYSGAHEYAIQLKRSLEANGHSTQLFSIAGIGKSPIEQTQKLFINSKENNTDMLREYDAIHFTSVSENTKEQPRFLKDSKRFKYFVTIHSCEHDLQSANGWQKIVKNAYGIIFTSESNRQYYVKNYPKLVGMHNSYVMNMPYVTSNMKENIKKDLAICTSRFVSYKKNKEFLTIAREFPNMQFTQLSTLKSGKNSFVNGLFTKTYLEQTKKKISGLRNAGIIDYYDCKDPKQTKTDFLENAKYLVDLSSFSIDRDRVQYTTLEAMDYGCVPIFHKNFFGHNLKNYKNGVAVENEIDAAKAIRELEEKPSLREAIINANYKFIKIKYGQSNVMRYVKAYSRTGGVYR